MSLICLDRHITKSIEFIPLLNLNSNIYRICAYILLLDWLACLFASKSVCSWFWLRSSEAQENNFLMYLSCAQEGNMRIIYSHLLLSLRKNTKTFSSFVVLKGYKSSLQNRSKKEVYFLDSDLGCITS